MLHSNELLKRKRAEEESFDILSPIAVGQTPLLVNKPRDISKQDAYTIYKKGTLKQMSDKKPLSQRSEYFHFQAIPTRWMDNDAYGHVNNVQYYSYFDTAVNQFLVEKGILDIQNSPNIGLVVETQCRYSKSIVFPETVHAGIRVAHIGNSSVRYELGLFRDKDDQAAAEGHFVHVYVDRKTNKPVLIPGTMRAILESITVLS